MIDRILLEKISDFNFWSKDQETGIYRKELKEVLNFVDDKNFTLIIAGIRRAGKTFLSRQILKTKIEKGVKPEQTLYINFEDPVLEPYLNIDGLNNFYQSYRYFLNKEKFAYIVLDEIQNVPKWEKWVRIMMEKKENVKFILTGSSSKFYKENQARILTGRALTYFLFPLSFSDFLKFKNYPLKKFQSFLKIQPYIAEYLEFGGFPLIVLEKNREKKQIYLKELFNDILIKDIIIKYKLRELDAKKLAFILVNQFSALVSIRRLKNLLEEIVGERTSPTSINRYLEYFSNSFIFFFVPIFSYKIKETFRYPKKVYVIDTGLINSLSLRFSENIGRLYENLVAKTLWEKYGLENIFYWKDHSKELDFVVKQGLEVFQLIQVCSEIKKKKIFKREISALLKASQELKCNNLLVITKNYQGKEKFKNKTIKFIPLWKWLLYN